MLKLHASEYDKIRCHGEEAYPNECCGILLGTSEGDVRTVRSAIRCNNVCTDSPERRYDIDPRDLVRIQREARERGLDIMGFYHSHPDHPAQWSPTDLEQAHWIGCSYVIIAIENGKAMQTKSFALTGMCEEEKALVEEEVLLIASD
ncbi:MAG: M67 family metallopeptidase [Candidatus Korobacteraceae bacterium]